MLLRVVAGLGEDERELARVAGKLATTERACIAPLSLRHCHHAFRACHVSSVTHRA